MDIGRIDNSKFKFFVSLNEVPSNFLCSKLAFFVCPNISSTAQSSQVYSQLLGRPGIPASPHIAAVELVSTTHCTVPLREEARRTLVTPLTAGPIS